MLCCFRRQLERGLALFVASITRFLLFGRLITLLEAVVFYLLPIFFLFVACFKKRTLMKFVA